MAAQSLGSVKVLPQPANDSFEAMATELRSSRSVSTWNSSSAPPTPRPPRDALRQATTGAADHYSDNATR
jgi:hypothetical protein